MKSHVAGQARRCWVEVDGRALRHNLKLLRKMIPRTTHLMAVVKANAYGHGLIPVARELVQAGADWLGVANVTEGATLREAGLSHPILLLSALLPEEMEEAIRYDLAMTVSSWAEARQLDRRARQLNEQAVVHFKIDTGMGRLGCWHEGAREVIAKIRRLPGVRLAGLCTHFASADDNPGLTQTQARLIAPFFAENQDLLRHAANSPAITHRYGYEADLIRAGLALYGGGAYAGEEKLGFHSVLTWKSRVTLLREVGPQRTVSYGAVYRTRKTERHATVAIGYGDGYFRAHSQGKGMLVRGQLCPIRGRVTMDQVVLDVTRIPACRVGDEVVALGMQKRLQLTARELAMQAGTIPWEIFTNIGIRVPRVYRNFLTATEMFPGYGMDDPAPSCTGPTEA